MEYFNLKSSNGCKTDYVRSKGLIELFSVQTWGKQTKPTKNLETTAKYFCHNTKIYTRALKSYDEKKPDHHEKIYGSFKEDLSV